MERIQFGTDGWRGIIAHQFTVANVARITQAASVWLLNKFRDPTVIVAYDTRFQGRLFAETAAKVLASRGISVLFSDGFVTTPMLSLAVREWGASLGIMITGSHNDYRYNGYKLKGSFGGPLQTDDLKNIEHLINADNDLDPSLLKWDQLIEKERIRYADLEALYVRYVERHFDLNGLRNRPGKILFDAMYGGGQQVIQRLLPEQQFLHIVPDPLFGNLAPEPVEKNLDEMKQRMSSTKSFELGIAIDGDGDRIAMIDARGNYLDSHHIILILIHLLAKYGGQRGKVVIGFSSTMKVEQLAAHYGFATERVPIGFKDICRIMLREEVLVGGEESGGMTVLGYLPERDAIWVALTILKYLDESGKKIEQILEEIRAITGYFSCARHDLQIGRDKIKRIMDSAYKGELTFPGSLPVERMEALDGVKFILGPDEWVMIRPSGTEPLLRTYAEAATSERAGEILRQTAQFLLR